MKLDMAKDRTRRWFAVVAASSLPRDTFSEMIEHNDWSESSIDFKVLMNGYEISELDDLFDRLHRHISNQANRISELENQLKEQDN